MTRLDSFGRSAAFAAVAALAWMPWLVVVGPVLGGGTARTLYLVVVTALYAGGLAKSPPRRASTAVGMALAGTFLVLLTRGGPELCVALAATLGVARSVLTHRTAAARAVVLEGVLLAGGLAFARFLGGGALAVWGFFLVQSCFFLVGGVTERAPLRSDPFDEAWARAMDVMERPVR
jgi:hypothetical protein